MTGPGQWLGLYVGDVIGFGLLAVVSIATLYLALRKKRKAAKKR